MAISPHHLNTKPDSHINEYGNSACDFKAKVAVSVATILFYLFCTSALAWIGIVLMLYLIGCMAAIYVIAGLLPAMNALQHLAEVILKSLRLPNGPDCFMSLSRDEAPELYAMADRVAAEIGVEPPENISLDMSVNAGVSLLSCRGGKKRCKLFIGYDLMAVLTKSELESVLAHELAHSRLESRAYNNWCSKACRCVYRLNKNLANLVAEHEQAKKKFYTASVLHLCSAKLAPFMYRAYARFSQQGELAADHLAAECCGSDIFGSALVRVEVADCKRNNINWRDRKIYTQRSENFCEWLRDKLTPVSETQRMQIESYLMESVSDSEYRLHPPLRDRLAALPSIVKHTASNDPAIQLLAYPDDVALRYVRKMEKTISEEERKETSALLDMANKRVKTAARRLAYTTGQTVGILAVIIGMSALLTGIALFFCENMAIPGLMATGCALLGVGFGLYVKCARREKYALPSPSFKVWHDALISDTRETPIGEWRADVERQVSAMLPGNIRTKGALAAFWADVCYAMLGNCDYRGALVASEFCLAADQYRLEGLLTRAISLAWLRDDNHIADIHTALNKAYSGNRFNKSMSWGLSWAFLLSGDWLDAEMYLLKAIDFYPDDATVMAALSICQQQCGRLYMAVDSARRAVAVSQQSTDLRRYYADLLLDAGQPKEALAELETLGSMASDDFDTMLQIIYAHGLCGNIDQSNALADRMEELFPGGKTVLKLAQVLEGAGYEETGLHYWKKLLGYGFYPEALYALSYMEYKQENYDKAREMLASTLDCTKTPGDGSVGPIALAERVCMGLLVMSGESTVCEAFRAKIDLNGSPSGAESVSLLIYARSHDDAKKYAQWLYGAMYPGVELPDTVAISKEPANASQPNKPVVPGIQELQFN